MLLEKKFDYNHQQILEMVSVYYCFNDKFYYTS